MTDLIIVGGGAAGMAAGILAARAGRRVAILEKNRQFGKKLAVTGNGRCNFTNMRQQPEYYRSDAPELAWKVLEQFPAAAVLDFFHSLGLEAVERNGYCYPASEAAGDVVKVLFDELCSLKIKCKTNLRAEKIVRTENGFQVQTEGYAYEAEKVLLTTGGLAAPVHGTEGDGYRMAERLGHHLITPHPALSALRTGEHPVTTLAGLRHTGTICLYEGRRNLMARDTGELQFTSYGISGIPAMQVSRFAARALSEGKRVWAELDFFPEQSEKELLELLHRRKNIRAAKGLQEWLIGWLPEKLIRLLLSAASLDGKRLPEELSEAEWICLAEQMKKMRTPVKGVRSYDTAQTTAGGVPLTECSPYLESLLVPGLYFAGEILDVDGACGGYNLQWAWASAACAVKGITRDRNEEDRI